MVHYFSSKLHYYLVDPKYLHFSWCAIPNKAIAEAYIYEDKGDDCRNDDGPIACCDFIDLNDIIIPDEMISKTYAKEITQDKNEVVTLYNVILDFVNDYKQATRKEIALIPANACE